MPTLDWLNRATAFTTAAQVPYRLLDTISTHGDAATAPDNLLIQGDNLEALKALLPFYRGQVKCIFIDPPYNTKSAFEHYDDHLEHSQWLSMMLPRLQLLRELLTEDGSIWVTIDDHEGHYLKVLMDEVFGRGNFVNSVIWIKTPSVHNNAEFFSSMNDCIHVFAKNINACKFNRVSRSARNVSDYTNPDNDPRGAWSSSPLHVSLTSGQRGAQFARTGTSSGLFPIISPHGEEIHPPKGRAWAYGEETLAALERDNRIWWGSDGRNQPRLKRFFSELKEGVVPTTTWSHEEVGHNQEAKKETSLLLLEEDTELFSTPKPERLLQRILHIATNPGDLVLDSFLGSGTTAAVAHKMGRRWIGIEMGEHAATHCLPRLDKVITGEQGGISQAVGWQGGGGFRFARLGAPIFDTDGCIHPDVRFATLAAFVWQQETGTAFDPAQGRVGTPWLGTHSVFDSCPRLIGAAEGPISLETASEPMPELVLRSRTAYYLLFNGILGDRRPAGGNVLTRAVLEALLALHAGTPHPDALLVVYGEANRLGPETLARARVTFKHIPYDVKAR
ncbi:site-specific DNA-methyltransferase [Pulveribacter suum]|uniref:site-specific DNA-methyltransferase (adenine-specific) n=1 Tax=Pulveribacter suum TaxID=2116657 RepID=A0A2P1NH27_9BURK|nr:site-specific DNA-methyltransferase [Pulveribacter suum]AVP56357.1 site-specific DNA-methyltransferase [Pulveribacter suum]